MLRKIFCAFILLCGMSANAATVAQWLKDGIPASSLPITPTKGTTMVADGTSFMMVPIGVDGQVFTADSGAATGISWGAPGGPPSGPAGGALSGTYPNPDFATVVTSPGNQTFTNAAVAGNTSGFFTTVQAGDGSGTGMGGVLSLISGNSGFGATGDAGSLNIISGVAISTNGNGGSIMINTGNANGIGNGGILSLISGASVGATGDGGEILLSAGSSAGGTGGNVSIDSGTGVTAGKVILGASGRSVVLGTSGGATGFLSFANSANANLTNLQAGMAVNAVTYTLPTDAPAVSGYVLSSTMTGEMSWAVPGTVTAVTATTPLISTGGATPDISFGTVNVVTTSDPDANVQWGPSTTLKKALVVQGVLGQAVPVVQVQDSTGAVLFSIQTPSGTYTGTNNLVAGTSAGIALTSGSYNTFFGNGAGSAVNSGQLNSLLGAFAGGSLTSGNNNVCVGPSSGFNITTGINNVCVGYNANGSGGTTPTNNVFIGTLAGQFNTADNNTFVGSSAGLSNTSGTGQAFFGFSAGYAATGDDNSIFGAYAGNSLTTGSRNSFFGKYSGGSFGSPTMSDTAMFGYQTGFINSADQNTFVGSSSGEANTLGTGQAFFGFQSGFTVTGDNNTMIGMQAGSATLTTGTDNVGLGKGVAFTNNNAQIVIGSGATATGANQFVVGASAMPSTNWYGGKGVVSTTATAYTINGTGGSGADNAGANLNLAGGKGTGTGAGGSVVFQTATAGVSSSTPNALTTVVSVNVNTATTSSTTGTVVVTGGAGISGSLYLGGGLAAAISTKTNAVSPYTALDTDYTLLGNPGAGTTLTINLPTAVGRAGKIFVIKKINANIADTVTIDASGAQTIDGALTQVLTIQYTSITIQSDGANWFIL